MFEPLRNDVPPSIDVECCVVRTVVCLRDRIRPRGKLQPRSKNMSVQRRGLFPAKSAGDPAGLLSPLSRGPRVTDHDARMRYARPTAMSNSAKYAIHGSQSLDVVIRDYDHANRRFQFRKFQIMMAFSLRMQRTASSLVHQLLSLDLTSWPTQRKIALRFANIDADRSLINLKMPITAVKTNHRPLERSRVERLAILPSSEPPLK
jgi:hypothetical protein